MFYENQPLEHQENYKKMLTILGNLTFLFSKSDCPYLPYRAHENIFCEYFNADNLARFDCSADAKSGKIGIGLKTWTGNDDQKIAEFGKLSQTYKDLSGIELVKKIAEYRNERIRVTKNIHGLDTMIYHIVKRIPNTMQIIECSFDYIDIDKIKILHNRGNSNNTYFKDNKHTYHFSSSKNTLYMIFTDYNVLAEFEVEIIADPYSYLLSLSESLKIQEHKKYSNFDHSNQLCLRLYSSTNDEKIVHSKSGLNQWNASGRIRDANEIYIPYPAEDRKKSRDFFPDRNTIFDLVLPNNVHIKAKVCQEDGKAIMSNPNKILGKWLLRDVFGLPEKTVITYEMLEKFGIDSVIFTKISDNKYKIDFTELGTYESLYETLSK